jgi:hypothetical protein
VYFRHKKTYHIAVQPSSSWNRIAISIPVERLVHTRRVSEADSSADMLSPLCWRVYLAAAESYLQLWVLKLDVLAILCDHGNDLRKDVSILLGVTSYQPIVIY